MAWQGYDPDYYSDQTQPSGQKPWGDEDWQDYLGQPRQSSNQQPYPADEPDPYGRTGADNRYYVGGASFPSRESYGRTMVSRQEGRQISEKQRQQRQQASGDWRQGQQNWQRYKQSRVPYSPSTTGARLPKVGQRGFGAAGSYDYSPAEYGRQQALQRTGMTAADILNAKKQGRDPLTDYYQKMASAQQQQYEADVARTRPEDINIPGPPKVWREGDYDVTQGPPSQGPPGEGQWVIQDGERVPSRYNETAPGDTSGFFDPQSRQGQPAGVPVINPPGGTGVWETPPPDQPSTSPDWEQVPTGGTIPMIFKDGSWIPDPKATPLQTWRRKIGGENAGDTSRYDLLMAEMFKNQEGGVPSWAGDVRDRLRWLDEQYGKGVGTPGQQEWERQGTEAYGLMKGRLDPAKIAELRNTYMRLNTEPVSLATEDRIKGIQRAGSRLGYASPVTEALTSKARAEQSRTVGDLGAKFDLADWAQQGTDVNRLNELAARRMGYESGEAGNRYSRATGLLDYRRNFEDDMTKRDTAWRNQQQSVKIALIQRTMGDKLEKGQLTQADYNRVMRLIQQWMSKNPQPTMVNQTYQPTTTQTVSPEFDYSKGLPQGGEMTPGGDAYAWRRY